MSTRPDTTLRCIYQNLTRHDFLLLQWWDTLYGLDGTGDLERLLCGSLHTPIAFANYFSVPDRLRYCLDDDGHIWFSWWVEPHLSGAIQGCWIHPRYRRTRGALDTLCRCITWALGLYPVLVSTTIQPGVTTALSKLGYSEPYIIPDLWPGGQGVCIQYLTREHWAKTSPTFLAHRTGITMTGTTMTGATNG